MLGGARVNAIQHSLQLAPDDAEGRAQLMSHVGRQIATQFISMGQLLGHGVESDGQFSHLPVVVDRDTHAEVTSSHGSGCRRQVHQRPAHPSREGQADDQSQTSDGQSGQQEASAYRRMHRPKVVVEWGQEQEADLLIVHHDGGGPGPFWAVQGLAQSLTRGVSHYCTLGRGQDVIHLPILVPGAPARPAGVVSKQSSDTFPTALLVVVAG